jgi:hypothetical protein
LYYRVTKNCLNGLTGVYVDDTISAGTLESDRITQMTENLYEAIPKEYDGGILAGIEFKRDANKVIVSQEKCIHGLRLLPSEANFADFRSRIRDLRALRHQLSRVVATRPDLAFFSSRCAQVTEKSFEKHPSQYIDLLNKAIRRAHEDDILMCFPQLDLSTLRVVVFADASFAQNEDLSSQVGYIVLLLDAEHQCAPIMHRSYKAKRTTQSELAAEAIALADGFDAAFACANNLMKLLGGKRIPIWALTDSKTLFDAILKGTATTEKRTLIEIAALKQAYSSGITSIGLISSGDNIADGLTKDSSVNALQNMIQFGMLNTKIKQFIIKPAPVEAEGSI